MSNVKLPAELSLSLWKWIEEYLEQAINKLADELIETQVKKFKEELISWKIDIVKWIMVRLTEDNNFRIWENINITIPIFPKWQ